GSLRAWPCGVRIPSATPTTATRTASTCPCPGISELHRGLVRGPASLLWAPSGSRRGGHRRVNCARFSLPPPEPLMSRVTLSRHLIEQPRSHTTPADLRFLIEVVARACKEISHAVSKGALGGVLGSMGTENVQ